MLDIVNEWCLNWKMKINMKKTKVVEFRKKGKEKSLAKFRLGNKQIENCSTYKYLGVIFDENATFIDNQDNLSSAGQRALGAVIAKYKNLENMGYDTFTKCFYTSICPIIDYGAEVWGYIKTSKLDNVALKAMCVFLGVHKFTTTLFLEGELAWKPAIIRRKLSMLRFWNRLILMDNNRLTYKIFQYECDQNGVWFTSIKQTFREMNMEGICDGRNVCNTKDCEKILLEQYATVWMQQIKRKPKLRTYCEIKDAFIAEKYVKLNLTRSQRSILAQTRSGTLPINIETGRFIGKKLEDRLCTLCHSQAVESEFHFIFHCDLYDVERNALLSDMDIDNAASDGKRLQYLCLLYPRKLAKFIVNIFHKRQRNLYNDNQ